MKLDNRLTEVAACIRWPRHADIGTDHAHLPLSLVATGRCEQVIGIELNMEPLARARAAVRRCPQVQIRQGDGFGPLQPGEVDGASICGMGAKTMLRMLKEARWLPEYLVLQPNADAQQLRHWAYAHSYHLQAERLVQGFWLYPVLALRRSPGPDPAYAPFARTEAGTVQAMQAAQRFGPLLLAARDPLLHAELHRQRRRLSALPSAEAARELGLVDWALSWYAAQEP